MKRTRTMALRAGVAVMVVGGAVVAVATPAYAASATISVSGSTLRYAAPAGVANKVTITEVAKPADTVEIRDTAVTISSTFAGCWYPVALDHSRMRCTVSGLASLQVSLGDRDDSLVNDTDRPLRASGGTGDDSIVIGGRVGAASTVSGGDGADIITSGPGDDAISGDAGSDTVRYTGLDPVTASLVTNTGTRATDTDTYRGIENLIGGGGADSLTGDDMNNMLDGGSYKSCLFICFVVSGADTIYGNGGHDLLYGRGGSDTIWGGDGNDAAWGGDADDYLYGEAGDDYLNGEALGTMYNEADGGPGYDTCISTEQLNCEVVG